MHARSHSGQATGEVPDHGAAAGWPVPIPKGSRVRVRMIWATYPAAAITVALAAGCAGTASASPGASGARPARSAGAGAASGSHGSSGGTQPGPATAAAPAGGTGHTVTLPSLTDRQLAGQRVIYSYRGLTPPAYLLKRIRQGEVAGVIFFSGNISSRAQIRQVAAELQKAATSPSNPVRHPLLLMTDQEGGEVRRLPGGPDQSEKQIGQSAHPAAAATSAGTTAGQNLHGVGLNVNLAPVLDVYRAAGNFIDEFGRSYSRHAPVVSSLGADFIKAQQKAGVAATSKHFPGLGAATRSQNTDERPVTLNVSKSQLRAVDELPYQKAIAAGTKLVMVSWASYPNLGSRRPAGLSSIVVQGELRKRLGYTGVTITDALEAGALRPFGGTAQRAFMAATAGMDLILCSGQDASQGIAAVTALTGAYRKSTLNHTKFRAAATRVVALRASLPS
jgi:beta-N-acetylhexosaminidase